MMVHDGNSLVDLRFSTSLFLLVKLLRSRSADNGFADLTTANIDRLGSGWVFCERGNDIVNHKLNHPDLVGNHKDSLINKLLNFPNFHPC